MSKKQFKAHASSSRATLENSSSTFGFGPHSVASGSFGAASSPLSYLAEQPDLSSISDPNIVVSFKNLSKKDSTTKAKAIDDLQTYVTFQHEHHEEIEEAFLNAWTQLYPRTSIDASRRVRQISHTLHGLVSVCSGKRIAKYMPHTIGAWLCGINDGDKTVMRSAKDALKRVFPTAEKQSSLSKVYHLAVIEYCRNAILRETARTLSDNRISTPEDSYAKYVRVIASSVKVITEMLTNLPEGEIQRYHQVYEELFAAKSLWDHVSSKDSSVRRAVLRLLWTCLQNNKELITTNIGTISTAILSDSAIEHQAGSSLEFSQSLLGLSASYPAIWSTEIKGRRCAIACFQNYVQHGSQGGPSLYWTNAAKLLSVMPEECLPKDPEQVKHILSTFHDGIMRKDEPRSNLDDAWSSYFMVAECVTAQFPQTTQEQIMSEMGFPIVRQYIRPNLGDARWTTLGPRALAIIASAMRNTAMMSVAESEWPSMARRFLEDIQTSSPEQSKNFESSQSSIMAEGARWFLLQSYVLKQTPPDSFLAIIYQTTAQILDGCVGLLKARNGKPFGAAATLEAALRYMGFEILQRTQFGASLTRFIRNDLPSMVFSPSCSQLISILYACHSVPQFGKAWTLTLHNILNSPDHDYMLSTLQKLFGSDQMLDDFQLPRDDSKLQAFITNQVRLALNGDTSWTFLTETLCSSATVLSTATADQMLIDLTKTLTIDEKAHNALSGLEEVVKVNQRLLKNFLDTKQGSTLLQHLLLLTESPHDEIARAATNISHCVETLYSRDFASGFPKKSIFGVIHTGLYETGSTSLAGNTLVDLAHKFLEGTHLDIEQTAKQLLPDTQLWRDALQPFLDISLPPSLAITNLLGGAIYLLAPTIDRDKCVSIGRDSQGYSAAIRIAYYTAKLIKTSSIFQYIDQEQRADVYRLLLLTAQLSNDNLTLAGANMLWSMHNAEVESDILEFLSTTQSIFTAWLHDGLEILSTSAFINLAHEKMFFDSMGASPSSFYNACAFASSKSALIEMYGWQQRKDQDLEANLRRLRESKDDLSLAAFMIAFKLPLGPTPSQLKTCNELVANLTGLDISLKAREGLGQLILLNLALHDQQHLIDTIAKQRLIFFVKHAIPWLHEHKVYFAVKSELCKALTNILSSIKDIYGAHWADILNYLVELWSSPNKIDESAVALSQLPLTHASLKLFAALQALTKDDDSNDDLKDAWQESIEVLSRGLINLLKQLGNMPDDSNQPLQIVKRLLAHQITQLSSIEVEAVEIFYPLINVESLPVQMTAFHILHKQILLEQEQVSLNVALEKSVARLPEELLSLLLESPTLDSFADVPLDREMPVRLRGYLASWLLTFDHFTNASEKVRADYSAQLKEGVYLCGLLDFTFHFLGHSRGKPVDVSGFDVSKYTLDTVEYPVKDIQYLLTHLYYLCLKHLPTLTKAWWIDCKSRQTVVNVEAWTERFISPHIISDALNTVTNWASNQDSSADEALIIKANYRTKEVTASKEIDDQLMTILIRLPSNFPLGQAIVEGGTRVAVDEKKWRSWLLNTQGVITFSNNSITDGLVAFRRNIVGALKASNHPHYDFLTGTPPSDSQSFRETLRESQVVNPDQGNERLRKQIHKLQYEVDSLRQEREVTALRYQGDLRAAQSKAESDLKRAKAAESSQHVASTKHDAIAHELQKVQECSAAERGESERRVRALQEHNRTLQEELEEVQTEVLSQRRKWEYDMSELQDKLDVLQQVSEDLHTKMNENANIVQATEERHSHQETEVGILRNEILRLKTQAGDADALTIIKQELTDQVAHIKKVEATNNEQYRQLKQYRERQKSIEIVEEEKRMLENQVRIMGDLRIELTEAQFEKKILEDERISWSAYLENQSVEGETHFDSPRDLAAAYIQERLEKTSLVEQLGRVSPDLFAKDEIIKALEKQKAKLEEEANRLRASASGPDSKLRTRLERQRTLAVKEVDYLRAQLRTFDVEENDFQPQKHDEQKTKRIQELEDMVDQYREEVQLLNQGIGNSDESNNTRCKSPAQGMKRPHDDVDDERYGELCRKNRVLQENLSQVTTSYALLQRELDVHKSQLSSMRATMRTRVLELRSNPTADAEALKMRTLHTLRAENIALLRQLEASEPSGTPIPLDVRTVPDATIERLRADIAERDAALASKDKHLMRLKQIWSAKSLEFREAVASCLGWNLDFMPNGRVRVTSTFYPGIPEDEGGDGGNSIIFDGENGTMKVSGGPQSAFAGEIRGLIEFWVEGRTEIPCFLAAATLEFYERTTRAQKM